MRTSDDQGVVEAIQPRVSLLYRSNEIRQKLIAANVDQLVIVVATEPAFSDELVARALLAAESEEIAPLIVLNKCDLADKLPAARQRLATLAGLGYPILELSALNHAEDLRPWLAGKTSVLVGQSGMGKSTLVNALIPEANAATREISQARLRQAHHDARHALPSRCRQRPDRLARPAGVRPRPSRPPGDRNRLPRIPPLPRPVPLPRLPARPRTGLRAACCRRGRNDRPRRFASYHRIVGNRRDG
jgi:ethanolamine utilization protein EutP (predicted NTPase)